MSTKLVIGLTDQDSELFFINRSLIPDPLPLGVISRDAYNLAESDSSIEKASLEWQLDTTLPAMNAVLAIVAAIKQRPNFFKIIIDDREIVAEDHRDFTASFEFVNLIPNLLVPEYLTYTQQDNTAIISTLQSFGALELDRHAAYEYQGIDESQTLLQAIINDDLSQLITGPVERLAVPAFRFSFYLGRTAPVSRNMSVWQHQWMITNQSALAAKGYEIDDPRSKIGALPIGVLLGDPMEQYEKIKQFRKICRIDIVSE